jgi:hypothetical protein
MLDLLTARRIFVALGLWICDGILTTVCAELRKALSEMDAQGCGNGDTWIPETERAGGLGNVLQVPQAAIPLE